MFVLLLVMSPFIWIPNHFTMTNFETREACEQALIEAKKQWSTINDQSRCIDLAKEKAIREKTEELQNLRKSP